MMKNHTLKEGSTKRNKVQMGIMHKPLKIILKPVFEYLHMGSHTLHMCDKDSCLY